MPRGVRAAAPRTQRSPSAVQSAAGGDSAGSGASTGQALAGCVPLCPEECKLTGGSDPWRPVASYLLRRTAGSDLDLVGSIMWAGPGGSGSGSGSAAIRGVPAGSELRLALLLAASGECFKDFTLGRARLLRAALDIASCSEDAAATSSQLAQLAAAQPPHRTPLLLTAQQLCCAFCVQLQLVGMCIDNAAMPKLTPGNAQLPAMSMTAVEVREELLAALQAGVDCLLRLEPHAPRTLLHAAAAEFSRHKRASVQSVEHCLQAVRIARQQGSRLHEVHASSRALTQTMLLLMVHEGRRPKS